MKKFLLLFLFVFFILGCDGKEGETGVAGVTGTGGCDFDEIFDEDTGICILNADYEAPADGVTGADGVDGKNGSQGRQGRQGNSGIQGEQGPGADLNDVHEYVNNYCRVDLNTGVPKIVCDAP